MNSGEGGIRIVRRRDGVLGVIVIGGGTVELAALWKKEIAQ